MNYIFSLRVTGGRFRSSLNAFEGGGELGQYISGFVFEIKMDRALEYGSAAKLSCQMLVLCKIVIHLFPQKDNGSL